MTTARIVITEDVADTMRLASLGPRWSDTYAEAEEAYRAADPDSAEEAAAEAVMDLIEDRQQEGEADYAARWQANCERIAAERGFDAEVILDTTVGGTHTDSDDGGDWVERQIWQDAHDATVLPKGW